MKPACLVALFLAAFPVLGAEEIIHVFDDFEDGEWQNPPLVPRRSERWAIISEPPDYSNMVARAHGSEQSGTYLDLTLDQPISVKQSSMRCDFLVVNPYDFAVYVIMLPPGDRRMWGTLAAIDGVSFFNLMMPKFDGGYYLFEADAPQLEAWHWYTLSYQYDFVFDTFTVRVTDRDSQQIVGEFSLPSVDDVTGLDINTIHVGMGQNDTVYFDNVLFSTICLKGDFDCDADVDGDDFLTFSACFNGSLNSPSPACENQSADLDQDSDVDTDDFLTFSGCFNGALNPPNCP